MDRTEKALKTTFQLKVHIEALLETSKKSSTPACPQKAMVYLTQLNSLEMTWAILGSTKIGYTVNDLRVASSNANVKQRAKQLLKKWRGLQAQAEGAIETVDGVVRRNGAMREQSDGISTTTSTNTASSASGPRDSNPTYDKERDEIRWSVRYAAEGGMGLKMIFAKRKHAPFTTISELKRRRVM